MMELLQQYPAMAGFLIGASLGLPFGVWLGLTL